MRLDGCNLWNQSFLRSFFQISCPHSRGTRGAACSGQSATFHSSLEQKMLDCLPVSGLFWLEIILFVCYNLIDSRCSVYRNSNSRLNKLKEIRWQLGAVLPEEIRSNLAPYEVQWFVHYCDTLTEYMSRLNDQKGLDLTLYQSAPKCLYVQVRCLHNYGDFELEDGTVVVLSPGSMVR